MTLDTVTPATTPAADARADTRDMPVVHRVFRREFRLLPEMVRVTAAGDRERAALVADWALELTAFLHHHHTNEDDVVWPLLHERAPLDAVLVETMERQHATVATLLAPIGPLASRWRTEPTVANREVLASALVRVHPTLVEHLDLEEREVLPLIARHLTAAEYAQLAERGRAAIEPSRMMTVLGAFLEEATPEEVELLTADMPTEVKAAWSLDGRPAYERQMRRLRSGS